MKLSLSLVAAVFAAALSTTSFAQTRLSNRDAIIQQLGLSAYNESPTLGLTKVAVLDNGFAGFDPNANLLPSTTKLVSFPAPLPGFALDGHGLGMAQIAWGVAGEYSAGPEFHLVNARGYRNLKAAVDYVLQNKIPIVLYAQTWEWGGNFDGQGFINQAINQAATQGVIWINAAGNVGGSVYNGHVSVDATTGMLNLPGPTNTLRFTNKQDANAVSVTLAWSDFTNSELDNTKKDLDIFLYDERGNQIPTTNKIQKGEAPVDTDPNDQRSSYAREQFTAMLNRGDYTMRIQDKSHNFVSDDRIRVIIETQQPGTVDFTDKTSDGEIGVAADNPNVITVGDCSENSAVGPTMDGRMKPDVVIQSSEVKFTDGKRTEGSSNASAMFAGVVATLMANEASFDKTDLQRYLNGLKNNPWGQRCGKAPVWRTPSPSELIQITQ
ncbi:MAG: S8 family serine peptidase [Bdellovibrionales bacterium]|nr:S8 family serine peptidase [Bdellovibrionales bacterium]